MDFKIEGEILQITNETACPGCEACAEAAKYTGKWTFSIKLTGPSGLVRELDDPRGTPVFDSIEEARAASYAAAQFAEQTLMSLISAVDKAVENSDSAEILSLIKRNMPSHADVIH